MHVDRWARTDSPLNPNELNFPIHKPTLKYYLPGEHFTTGYLGINQVDKNYYKDALIEDAV
jgi:hypothetical protein